MAELGRSPGRIPPGWYHDSTRTARWRYWNGDAWTPWIADGPTATQDAGGAPDAPPPAPMSHAMGGRPPNPLPENARQAHVPPTAVEPEPEVRLPPWQLGGQPSAPEADPKPAFWLATTIVGGLITLIGAVTYANAPPFSDGSESPAAPVLGVLLIVIGLVVLGIGALGFTITLAIRNRNRRRRRRLR